MKFGLLLAAHIIPEWAEYYVDYELLKELIYQLCGVPEEKEACCTFLRSKIHPDDVDEELDAEIRRKMSKELRLRLSRTGQSLKHKSNSTRNSEDVDMDGVYEIGLVDSPDRCLTQGTQILPDLDTDSHIFLHVNGKTSSAGCDEHTPLIKAESMAKNPIAPVIKKVRKGTEISQIDKKTVILSWMTEISVEQQKVSQFYSYMLGLVNEEMAVVKEQSRRYLCTTGMPSTPKNFLENIYYEKNGRPLDSPKNTRRKNVFSVKPLVRKRKDKDQKTEGMIPLSSASSASSHVSQRFTDTRSFNSECRGRSLNRGAFLVTPLREQVLAERMKLSNKMRRVRRESALGPTDRALVRDAIYTIYQRVVSMQNFVKLNALAFTKICKKFDKRAQCETKSKLIQKTLWKERSKEIAGLEKDIIRVYADIFESGDIFKAKVQLSHTLTAAVKNSKMFKVGLKMGFIAALGSWVIFSFLTNNIKSFPHHCIYVYRGIACVIYGFWLWGVDVYIWTKWCVNYSFVMEFNPQTRQPYFKIFDKAANLTLVYLINTLVYVNEQKILGDWHLGMSIPYSLLVYIFLQLFMPMEFCFGMLQSRKTLWDSLWHIIISPFGRVRFRDTFIADVMTSLVKVFCDLYMATCLAIMDQYLVEAGEGSCHFSKTIALPIVICIPYYWRFMQSVHLFYNDRNERTHHFLNSVKYTLTMLVALLSALHSTYAKNRQGVNFKWGTLRILWIVLTISSTIYTFLWDVMRDMALFQDRRGLRPELMYPICWYYLAIGLDLVLRFLWVFTLMPTTANPYYIETNDIWFVAIIACTELTRRAMWALFRVENAQISNKSEFLDFLYVPMLFGTLKRLRSERKMLWDSNGFLQVMGMVLIVGVLTFITALTK